MKKTVLMVLAMAFLAGSITFTGCASTTSAEGGDAGMSAPAEEPKKEEATPAPAAEAASEPVAEAAPAQ